MENVPLDFLEFQNIKEVHEKVPPEKLSKSNKI